MSLTKSTQGLKVFVSYSHKDMDYLNRLKTHTAVMRRQGLISVWYDREITAGANIENEILSQLASCDVFLFLVSSDYLDSYWCVERELTLALEREAGGSMWAIPVIVRPCDWKQSEFSNILALPRDGKPISTWDNQDTAFNDVVAELRRKISGIAVSDSTKFSRSKFQIQPFKGIDITGPATEIVKRRIDEFKYEAVVSNNFRQYNQLRTELNPESWSPFFNYADHPEIDESGFWVCLRDKDSQKIVGRQAFQLITVSTSLGLWAPQFVIESHKKIGQKMELLESPDSLSVSSTITGKLVFHGDFWVSSELRNREILELFSKFGLLVANDSYQPNAVWCLVSNRMAAHGHLIRMGYATIEKAFLRWKVSAEGIDQNEWIGICRSYDLQRLAKQVLKGL